MNIGDDVTINGVITEVRHNELINDNYIRVVTKSGRALDLWESDINTVRPKIEIPEEEKPKKVTVLTLF